MKTTLIPAGAALAAAILAGCTPTIKTENEVTIKPIQVTIDVNLKVDQELNQALSSDAKNIKADPNVNWFVDYNDANIDPATGRPVGTLRIPSFLRHATGYIDSRSILRNTVDYVGEQLLALIKKYGVKGLSVNPDDIEKIVFTTATELEFWVKTPSQDVETRLLSASQKLQEQYWQRTHGVVRTALEQTVERLEKYGLNPEMGHKEVGGIKAQIDDSGKLIFVLEQIEVDWAFTSDPVQTADNEIQARIIVREVFRENGLKRS